MTPSDWRTYRDLRLRALQDAPRAFATKLADVVHNPDSFWQQRLSDLSPEAEFPIFAKCGSKVVGLAWGRIESGEPNAAHLFHMWVAPENRRNGVGRMLIEAVVAWAKCHGAATLNLTVACDNPGARQLYLAAGFMDFGEPAPMRGDSSALEQQMRRALA